MRDQYRGVTLSVEDHHWWYRGRRLIIREVLDRAPLPPAASILDAGCGGGGNLVALAAYGSVTGLEPAGASLEAARARGVGEVVEGSIEALPFADDQFDLAAALDVIEHVDDGLALSELRRVVKPEGRLLVTVPAYQRLFGPHDIANDHRRRYNATELTQVAAAHGWRPSTVTYFNSIALPLAAVHRAIQRQRIGDKAPAVSDFERTPAWMNQLLLAPVRLEARMIRTGRRIPAGLSVLGHFANDSMH
jgi:SAM-dependent methyltransferase